VAVNQRGGRKTEKAFGYTLGKHKRLTATLPAYLFDWLKNKALHADRSISAQIVLMLESYIPGKAKRFGRKKQTKRIVRSYRTSKIPELENHGKY
jgi:hypothetical protein